jgi:murein DD-endopeptidase MepM/ murein hydrolase activator NlpD
MKTTSRWLLYILVCVFTLIILVPKTSAATNRASTLNFPYYSDEVSVSCGATDSTILVGADNGEKIWNFLIAKGLSPVQAAGVMGNLQVESGYDPFNQQDGVSWPGAGWGLAQWTAERRDALKNAVVAELGPSFYVPTEEAGSMLGGAGEDRLLSFQLDYLHEESQSRESVTYPDAPNEWEGLKRETTVEGSVIYWEANFERAGKPVLGARLAAGNEVLAQFGSETESGTSTSNAVACAEGQLVGGYSLPVDKRWYDEHPEWFTKAHHDYPASDIPVPVGTPVYAISSGTIYESGGACGVGVRIEGSDGLSYSYCHGTDGGFVAGATEGSTVRAGQLIMHSGNTGHSTGPHLHVGITLDNTKFCPQTLFIGIVSGTVPDPTTLPTSGCTYSSRGLL